MPTTEIAFYGLCIFFMALLFVHALLVNDEIVILRAKIKKLEEEKEAEKKRIDKIINYINTYLTIR